MIKEFEDILSICNDHFGDNNVSRSDSNSAETIELTINTSFIVSSPVQTVEIGMYKGVVSKAFMHFDEFDFEYDTIDENTIHDMNKYLTAIKENKLSIEYNKILGMKFNKKIVIKP